MTPEQNYSIDYQGLTIGNHRFEFAISDDIFTLWEESEVKKGDFTAVIELKKMSSMMELDLDIRGEAEITCDRCLENFMMPVKYKGHLIVKISDQEGEPDGDIMWIHPSDPKLSLAQYIYESIILSLPYQRVHQKLEDCNPDMLSRFKIVDESEIEELIQEDDAQTLGEIAFQELEALKK